MNREFRVELTRLINRHSMENGSNTPDFILADYLSACLDAFDGAMQRRDRWHTNVCQAPVGFDGDETKSEIEWCGNALPCEVHK